jgi:hypothetical protein
MKKIFTLFLVFALVFSFSITASAAGKSGKDNAKASEKVKSTTSETVQEDAEEQQEDSEEQQADSEDKKDKKTQTIQKKFKAELNAQKKELQQEKSELNKEKETLQTQYETLLAAGDTVGAEAVLEEINSLSEEAKVLQAQIKEAINERYMIVKTMYSEGELAQFESAADLIEQMYENASTLEAGCVTVNNNLIKFDAPAYLKGGVTLVPIRAIAEELDAEVTWDAETNSVTIVKDDKVIEMTANSTTILVNGEQVEMSTSTEITCGRTYLPLRFLAEALGFEVSWDGENELISIEDETTDETTDESTDEATDTTTDTSVDGATTTTEDPTTE